MNLEELKQKLVEHLGSMVLKEMSVEELRTYADTVRIVNDLFKLDVLAEALNAMTEKTFSPTYPMDRGFVGVPFDDATKT